ncbi:MAG: sugar ABC transporter ATP-binding protein [Actinobacteria bacterium]|nr:sugar ABC transporter ATP-binding protein [Actinomycetota bacterium]
MPGPRLEATKVSKTFGATTVLDSANLVVQPGEIHALVGQNGSGKSTLVKVLTGFHAPDPGGTVLVDGRALSLPIRWQEASAAGISVVHQDLGLLDQLSVAENVGVGGFIHSRYLRKIDWRAQRRLAQEVLDRLGVDVDPAAPVASLTASQRAEVGIARALRGQEVGSGLVILDEATRALPREELTRFHALLKRVVAGGTSVLMVSHNLQEVLSLSDKVTVLRDGRAVGSGLTTTELSEQGIARLMLGKSVGRVVRAQSPADDAPIAAAVEGLTSGPVESVSFAIREGEVVGFTGLPGSGFELIPYLITGARRANAGTLTTALGRVDLSRASVADCLTSGVALVPERRDRDGLAYEMSIQDNIALPSLSRRGRPWHVSRSWQLKEAADAIGRLGIHARSAATLVKELSGGNQQKVLVAKWLSVGPRLFVLHEPTQAVDVGARRDLLQAVRDNASSGLGVLLVSIEPADLVEVCDRILVFRPGMPFLELRSDNPDEILDAVYSTASSAAGGNDER